MDRLWLLWCAACIIVFFGLYGFLQERIMSLPYGVGEQGNEYFSWSVALVLMNRLVGAVAGMVMALLKGESWITGPAKWKYMAIAGSNIIATSCQYEALKYVSFPTQTLGKSMKMMPAMAMNYVVSKKTFTLKEWVIAILVSGGCAMFMLTGSISSKKAKEKSDSIYGIALLVAYLAFDQLTPSLQDRLFNKEKAPRHVAMFFTDLSSAATSAFYIFSAGVGVDTIAFVTKYPAVIWDGAALSAAAVAGKFAIYSTIANFGSVVLAAIMNVRMLVQVVVSIAVRKHAISAGQVAGLTVTFGALFYQVSQTPAKKNQKPSGDKTE